MKSRRHFTCFIIVTFSMGQARTVACSQALAPNAPPVGAPFPLPLRPGSDIRPPSAPCPPSLHAALPLACTHCHTSLVPPQGLCTAPPPAWKAHPSEAPMAGFLTCSSSAQCHRLRDTILTILLPFVAFLPHTFYYSLSFFNTWLAASNRIYNLLIHSSNRYVLRPAARI